MYYQNQNFRRSFFADLLVVLELQIATASCLTIPPVAVPVRAVCFFPLQVIRGHSIV